MDSHVMDQIWVMAQKELKQKYKRTALGFLWSFLMPVAQTIVFFLVFSTIIRFEMPHYILYLISGIFLWQSFTNMFTAGLFAFLGNASLIKKTRCHRFTLVCGACLAELFHLTCTIPLLLLAMLIFGVTPGWTVVLIPYLLVLLFLSGTGLALIAATLNLFFRDLERINQILIQLWFFVTPIFYPAAAVPEQYRGLLSANPFYFLLDLWRGVFYQVDFSWVSLAAATFWAALLLTFGIAVYAKYQRRFAEEI